MSPRCGFTVRPADWKKLNTDAQADVSHCATETNTGFDGHRLPDDTCENAHELISHCVDPASPESGFSMHSTRPPRHLPTVPGARNGEPLPVEIPDVVIRRLPLYVRTLQSLIDQTGSRSVSSDQLADALDVSGAQIRRDLSYFGRFGTQGKGYDAERLIEEINRILQLDQSWDVALVGFGNLGRAIAQYGGFVPSTFRIAAIFDRNEERIGSRVGDLEIYRESVIAERVRLLGIRIGIVAVPNESAQGVVDALVEGGVEAILNYAPIHLRAPAHVTIREVDPVGAMQSMTYYLKRE
jgi:redox-sensing transcriptional repressor